MSQYNILNVKSCNYQFNKLKWEITNRPKVTLSVLANVVGDSND